jgi:hypothetical protein
MIQGLLFTADLTVLPSEGIDVILGMDWLTAHKGVISCLPRLVTLEHPSGKKVEVEPLKSRDVPQVYNPCRVKTRRIAASSVMDIPTPLLLLLDSVTQDFYLPLE